MTILLSLLLGLALLIGLGVIVLVLRRPRREGMESGCHSPGACASARSTCSQLWPGCWMVIKSRNLFGVTLALGLRHSKPCSWLEGLAGLEPLFIAPPVKGWILVAGSGLPDPCEDPDACFRFVLDLSRKLGKVQFFCTSRLSHHHAWGQAKNGRLVRAYAWAGKTLWNQGAETREEKALGLTCYDYADPAPSVAFAHAEANAEKVALLAARWSLDPERLYKHLLQPECGIAGELARRY